MWTKKQIEEHKEAAKLLNKIKNQAFSYIQEHPKCTEYEVQQFVVDRFKQYKLKSAIADPIVAFGSSSCDFHYAASKKGSRKLKPGTPIMLDIWAGLNTPRAPFADITWMAFYGSRVPQKFQKVFDVILKARSASVSLLRSMLRNRKIPTGYDVEHAAMQVLLEAGYTFKKEIQHTTGHSIGTTSPHGRYGGIVFKNRKKIKKNLGYTIEPGLYFHNQFGVRSEIDFYIDSKYKLHITTPMQRKLVML